MNQFADLWAPIWAVLNYPFIVVGKSAITLWVILLNIVFVLTFLFASSKAKEWLIAFLARKNGVNLSNWRTTITLGYYVVLVFGLIGILQSTGLDLSLFTVLTGVLSGQV